MEIECIELVDDNNGGFGFVLKRSLYVFIVGGTSDLYTGGTSYPFLTGRLEEEGDSIVPPSELNVVRDYTPPTKTIDVHQPTVQRDFQADNIVFPQTINPNDRPRLQIPVLSLQESGRLVDSIRPSSDTIPNDLVIIRDRLTENTEDPLKNANIVKPFIHSRLSDSGQATANINVHTATRSPVQMGTSGNFAESKVERNKNNPDLLQETTIVQVPTVTGAQGDTPDNLPVERDREGAPASQTVPPDLVIIRDSVANEDSGHIITTRAVTDTGTAVSTKTVGNGIIVLLPIGGGK